ncbi:H-type small acid-soluble spore protein [Virgibacillus indicus]|uniref:Small, acid-soluble spore protein H n=1 Tax=Virgibacillus indicus TaxID=2024554 RepID=A0A265ND18_9BACI|nr:H-type small acid-soluble spore protein [Virgibacillus indicus]OZU89364.1 H-type small acid-soluble spore protein [Virgibacillus indicus]
MERERVQEIMESIPMVNVNYHGIPVYIQNVHSTDETATVFPLDNMEHVQDVDLNGLEEIRLENNNP